MANITYENKQTVPSGRKLIFNKQQDGQVVSESIKLVFKMMLHPLARKPIKRIRLTFEMLYPNFYEFENNGSVFQIEYLNKSQEFSTGEIKFKVKIVDPRVVLEKEVIFQVTVMDVDEGIIWPVGGGLGFYSWEPIPPPVGSLLKNIPFNLT